MTTLRNLGLREQIVTRDGGYALGVGTRVVLATEDVPLPTRDSGLE